MCSGQSCSHLRAAVRVEGDRERRGNPRALRLSLFDAATAPPDLVQWLETTGGLVDVHDVVCADSVRTHQSVQYNLMKSRDVLTCYCTTAQNWTVKDQNTRQ